MIFGKLEVGEQLKQPRLQRGYTQENLAFLLNISRSTYSDYEIRKTSPSPTQHKGPFRRGGPDAYLCLRPSASVAVILRDVREAAPYWAYFFAVGFCIYFSVESPRT